MIDNYYDDERGEWVTAESRYQAVATEERRDAIYHALYDEPRKAWGLILDLLAEIPEDTVDLLGAGPLEDFVRRYAATFITEIEAEAAHNPRFRSALLEIWLPRGELPKDIEARVAGAAGPTFRFFDE
jgi:uncharacterized protein DUF6869